MKRVCPLCERENFSATAIGYSRAPWELKECGGCGFVYLENPPKYEALSQDFAWEQTYRSEMKRRAAEEPVLFKVSRTIGNLRRKKFKRNKLRRLLVNECRSGNFLDVGCGSGSAFHHWGGKFVPHGVEISQALAKQSDEVARTLGGYVVHANAIEGVGKFPHNYFPAVALHSFLEHEINPSGLLKALRPVLAPGGKIIIKVPNYGCVNRRVRAEKWCGFRFPDHVNYFTPGSLRRIVTESGFAIARFSWRDHFPLSDSMWMVVTKAG
jgi:SAM-dependent methyltransferase